MQARLITDNERSIFNEYIKSVPKGHVFQLYEWGELKATTGWQPLRLLFYEGQVVKGALTILKRRIPGLGKYIFYAPRGPVCDITDYATMDYMWNYVAKLAKEHQAIFLKIDPDVSIEDQAFSQYLKDFGFRRHATGKNFEGIQPNFVFRLRLDKDEEGLLKAMNSKTRYNIRYAARKGVKIKDQCDLDDLKSFYEILEITASRDQFRIRTYEYFVNMYQYLVKTGYGKLFMAEYEGQCISGTLALLCGNKVWYSYGASDNTHRNKQPNYLLQWSMIKWALENKCEIYDFRGISGDLDENNPLYGLYRFKKGFGGDMVEFMGEYDLVFAPFYYKLWTKGLPAAKKARAKLLQILNR